MSLVYRAVAGFIFITLSAAAQAQAFEKITIKPAHPSGPADTRLQILPNGDLIAHSVNVASLLTYAYSVPTNPSPRLNNLPAWAFGERYDIEAKAPANTKAASPSDSNAQGRLRIMISQLLGDRFSLEMSSEDKRMPAYALTVSRSGPAFPKSPITTRDCLFDSAPDGCHNFVIGFGHPLDGNAISMDDLAHYIENWTDLPVVDRTKLSGLFTLHSEGWLPMRLPPPPPNGNGDVDFSSLPTLFTVLGRLGLELRRQEETLPVYTVERIQRPSFN